MEQSSKRCGGLAGELKSTLAIAEKVNKLDKDGYDNYDDMKLVLQKRYKISDELKQVQKNHEHACEEYRSITKKVEKLLK